jgi:SPP1 family predicted phage head-tail adaptor
VIKCCDLTAGMLRHSVTIQRLNKTPDGAGGWTKDWETILTTKAYIRVTGGTEQNSQDRLNWVQRQFAYVRYSAVIQAKDRLVFQGKNYQIRNLNNVEFRNKYLELDLESGVAT